MGGPFEDQGIAGVGRVVRLVEGDKLIIRCPSVLSDMQINHIKKSIKEWAGRDVGILFLENDIDFVVVKGL